MLEQPEIPIGVVERWDSLPPSICPYDNQPMAYRGIAWENMDWFTCWHCGHTDIFITGECGNEDQW